ncbi:MAG: hypothetical protein AAB510_02370 [Patescibacteria group bacterium]
MRKIFFAFVFVFSTLVFLGCEGVAPQGPHTSSATRYVATPTPTPGVTEVTPTKIGVSIPEENFIAFPACDGGECFEFVFVIGLDLPGESKPCSVYSRHSAYNSEPSKGGVKTAPEIKEGRRLHSLIPTLDPKRVRVMLVDGEVTEIQYIGEFIGSGFVSTEIIWEKNKTF